jgi:hypothetical protein
MPFTKIQWCSIEKLEDAGIYSLTLNSYYPLHMLFHHKIHILHIEGTEILINNTHAQNLKSDS